MDTKAAIGIKAKATGQTIKASGQTTKAKASNGPAVVIKANTMMVKNMQ